MARAAEGQDRARRQHRLPSRLGPFRRPHRHRPQPDRLPGRAPPVRRDENYGSGHARRPAARSAPPTGTSSCASSAFPRSNYDRHAPSRPAPARLPRQGDGPAGPEVERHARLAQEPAPQMLAGACRQDPRLSRQGRDRLLPFLFGPGALTPPIRTCRSSTTWSRRATPSWPRSARRCAISISGSAFTPRNMCC
jgi:hypothetical protein